MENALRLAVISMASDICARLDQLEKLGLGHLTPGRRMTMLSSGELQRVRLATQLISRLFGVLYVLDEPSAGLHPEDVKALLASLKHLGSAGNSLVIVEHNLDVMAEADWLTEIGPVPGAYGGEIVYNGESAGLEGFSASATSDYLFCQKYTGLRQRQPVDKWLRLEQIACNNISGLDMAIPLERLTAITGVSGSGKSTLLSRVLPQLVADLDKTPDSDEEDEDRIVDVQGSVVSISDSISRLIKIDQRPIGRTPRSNLATYTRLYSTPSANCLQRRRRPEQEGSMPAGSLLTCLLAAARPVKARGSLPLSCCLCPAQAQPAQPVAAAATMLKRLRWDNRTIADILELTVDQAASVFRDNEVIQRSLSALMALGLGYLRLGQPATELSGGECQRIKLASELQRVQRAHTLYLLDEHSSGLHPSDMDKRLIVLDRLVRQGHTVIMAEHNMRIVAEADCVIDLGPGSGEQGASIVAAVTPEEISTSTHSLTSSYLATQLAKRSGVRRDNQPKRDR